MGQSEPPPLPKNSKFSALWKDLHSMNRTLPDDSSRLTPLRILIVEDNADTAEITALFLSILNYEVKTVGTVQAARRAIASEKFNLVICDIDLPDGTGLDLMRSLKAEQPITGIAMTGFGDDFNVQKSKEAGFVDHLTKPVDFPTLVTIIERTCAAQA